MADSSRPGTAGSSVGILAVQFGLITQQQLDECIQSQRTGRPARTLDQVLIAKGFLTQDAVETLRRSVGQKSSGAHPAAAPAKPVIRRAAGATTGGKKPLAAPPPAPPAPPPKERATAARPAARSSSMMLGVALALLPLVALGGYLMYEAFKTEEPERNNATTKLPAEPPKPEVNRPPPPAANDAAPPPSKPKVVDQTIRVALRPLAGGDDIARRWNGCVADINAASEPDRFADETLDEMSRLVQEAKGTPHELAIRAAYAEVISARQKRLEQIFAFYSDESKRLQQNERFGQAIKVFDWFPGKLDKHGTYQRKIESTKKEIREIGHRAYAAKRTKAEAAAGEKEFEKAKELMLDALLMALPEFNDETYALISKYTVDGDNAANAAERAEMLAREEKHRGERDLGRRVLQVRADFLDLLSKRSFDAIDGFLTRQRQGAPEKVTAEVASLEKAFASIKAAFALVENALAAQKGRQVTLAFFDGTVKSLILRDVGNGKLTYTLEGRSMTESVYRLATEEVKRAGQTQRDMQRREFVSGVGELLAQNFVAAHAAFQRAAAEGAVLLAFVEGLNEFLAKNAPEYRERAKQRMAAGEWAKAVAEWSRLVDIPSERVGALKGRARSYYNDGNFVAAVFDIEHLFEENDFSAETVSLLSESYERAALIEKAIDLFTKVLQKNPRNGRVIGALGLLYAATHRWKEARELADRAGDVDGMNAQLGHFLSLVRDYRENPFAGQMYEAPFGRYDVRTNVSLEFAREVGRMMDGVYKDFVKFFPYKKNETLRFRVRVYATYAEFLTEAKRHINVGPGSRLGAYYSGDVKELVGPADDKDFKSTMTHEGLHQFMDFYIANCPMWFNEGYASYFETSTADEPKFNPDRHVTALGLLRSRRLPSVRDLIMMDRTTFDAGGHLHYGSSWSLIYYLNKTGRKAILDRYFEELMAGRSHQQAFDAVFGKIDLVSLETGWRRAIETGEYEKREE